MTAKKNLPSAYCIVLNMNGGQDTLECLASLAQLEYPNYQVILVDNGSIDDTVAGVRERFPLVRVIENRCNLGYSEGNNVGIRYSMEQGAEYIFLLNNDAVVVPNALSQLIQAAESNSTIGMLCPSIVSYFDHSKRYVGAKIFWGTGTVADIERTPDGLPNILDTEYAPGCALLVKSHVVRHIGLLDPEYFAYIEDVDWSLRCANAGYRVVVVPKATVYHKGAMDQSHAKSPMAEYFFRRNQFLFMRRYAKWHYWLPFLKHNLRKSLERIQILSQFGKAEHAAALVDGWWAGIFGKYGAQRIEAPEWFKKLIHQRLAVLLWLTGWLYFFDYQKSKRERATKIEVSV